MNTANTTLAVVIPLYNKANEIEATLRSVSAQVVAADEIIIVDDGSTDESVEVVKQLKQDVGALNGIRLIRQANKGVSAARNAGIQTSHSKLIAFLDADDIWDVHFIERMQALYTSFPDAGAYAGNYQKVCEGEYIDPKIRMDMPLEPVYLDNYFQVVSQGDLPFMTSSFCIRRELAFELGGFPVNEPMGEDQDLFAKVALSSKIAYDPMVVTYYHLDAENRACERNCPKQECGFSQRLNDACEQGAITGSLAEQIKKYTATHLLHLAKQNIAQHDYQTAQQLLNEPRCKLLLAKYMFLKMKCQMGQIRHH